MTGQETIKCIVVDDEPLAWRVLQKYISHLPSLELAATCANAMEAAAYLHQHPVDVMFLDIKMPELTGLEFLKTLAHPPQVIITSAFSEYALEGYEYSVLDYLLKPFSFERFLKAVNKIKKPASHTPPDPAEGRPAGEKGTGAPGEQPFIFLKDGQTHHRVLFSEISHIEARGNYVKVHAAGRKLMVADTMTHMEKRLPAGLFLRVHKSYIVSVSQIRAVGDGKLSLGEGETVIPIGNSYKMRVGEMLKKKGPGGPKG